MSWAETKFHMRCFILCPVPLAALDRASCSLVSFGVLILKLDNFLAVLFVSASHEHFSCLALLIMFIFVLNRFKVCAESFYSITASFLCFSRNFRAKTFIAQKAFFLATPCAYVSAYVFYFSCEVCKNLVQFFPDFQSASGFHRYLQ